ncbi:MAG: GGDEF domain-containing protein [Oscillospiraceae bacterium]|nr:GGDEF domain-containing protein [Oscillospiraceae bacterium]
MLNIIKERREFNRLIIHLYKNEKNASSTEKEILTQLETRRQKSNLKRSILLSAFLIFNICLLFFTPSMRSGEIGSPIIGLLIFFLLSLVVYIEVADHYAKIPDENFREKKLRNKVRSVYISFWAVFLIVISSSALICRKNINLSLFLWFLMFFLLLSIPVFSKIEHIILVPFAIVGIILYFSMASAPLSMFIIFLPIYFIILFITQINHMERLETYYESARNAVELGANKRRTAKVFEEVFDLAFELDVDKNSCDILRDCGDYSFVEKSGMSNLDFISRIIYATHEEDRAISQKNFNIDYLNNEFLGGRNQVYFEIRLNLKDDEYRWVSVLLTKEESFVEGGNVFLCLIQDVEERKKNENKLKLEAEKDPLTQLYNKVTTRSMIEECLEKNHTQQHALLIMDIDNFKTINDTRGHVVGDKILLAFATELNKSFRETDILGRTGGDEFIVLIKNVQSIALVCDKLQRLISSFKKYGIDNGFPGRLSISIGVAMYNKDGKTYEELFKKADAALYEAKRNGKDQYKFSITRS